MRKFASRAKRGLVVLSPLTLAVAMVVSAAPADNGVSPAIRAAMQRDLGLSSAQLSQYLNVERLAMLQEKQLAKAQGSNYAGSWIERGANGQYKLVVATTSIRPQKGPAGVEIRNARHSLAELDAAKGRLDLQLAQGAKVPKGVYSWAVDVESNSVVIGVGKGGQQAAVDFVARSGADANTVRFVTMAEQPTVRAALKGGLGYLRNPGDGYLYACSIGFNVTKGTTPGYVSAGHCGDAGEPTYLEGAAGTGPQWTLGPQIGTFQGSTFPNPGQTGTDMSWVQISGSNPQTASVYGWGGADVTVKGSTEGAVGTAI